MKRSAAPDHSGAAVFRNYDSLLRFSAYLNLIDICCRNENSENILYRMKHHFSFSDVLSLIYRTHTVEICLVLLYLVVDRPIGIRPGLSNQLCIHYKWLDKDK